MTALIQPIARCLAIALNQSSKRLVLIGRRRPHAGQVDSSSASFASSTAQAAGAGGLFLFSLSLSSLSPPSLLVSYKIVPPVSVFSSLFFFGGKYKIKRIDAALLSLSLFLLPCLCPNSLPGDGLPYPPPSPVTHLLSPNTVGSSSPRLPSLSSLLLVIYIYPLLSPIS